jgi:hypothetical protein
MSLKLLRKLFAVGLASVAGFSWATVSPQVPANGNMSWQDIAGIQWSTDNGATWGNNALYVGQTVEFKITMHKSYDGTHYADLVGAWIDFSGDGDFVDPSEKIFGDVRLVNNFTGHDNYINKSFDFITGGVTLTSAMVGDHFLLSRVTCSDAFMNVYEPSVGKTYNWNDQWASWATANNNAIYKTYMTPDQYYYQGESETRTLSIRNKVPEPSTLALFGVAMLGMGLRRTQSARV